MNKRSSSPSFKIFFAIAFFAFLLYLPVFLVPFAFHNDGAYITCKGNNIFTSFNEGAMDFVMARPVLAAYCGLQTRLIHNFSGLSACRFISFLLLTVFNLIFYRFLIKTCRLPVFWASCIVTVFFFIPPNLLSLIWCDFQESGVFNTILAALSYLIFNNSRQKVISILIASAFFLTALFCYPLSALVILVFPFSRVLFPGNLDQKEIRSHVLINVLFVIILLGIYRLLSNLFVVPWGIKHFHAGLTSGLYSLDLTNNLFGKTGLLVSLFGYSFRGIWDFSGHWAGGAIVLIFIFIACFIRQAAGIRIDTRPSSFFIERLCWGTLLFILANSPALLAKGCTDISDYGYRTLYPSIMMGTLVIFKTFISAEEKPLLTIRKLAILFVLSSVLMSFWVEKGTVDNSHMEYKLAMDQLGRTDLSKTKRLLFIVNKRGETLIGRKLPLEFSLLSVLTEHVSAYIIEYLHQWNYAMELPQIIDRGKRVFVPPGIKVIDLSSEALDKTKDPRNDDIAVLPRSVLADDLSIKVIESLDGKDVVMGFQTIFSGGLRVPLWLIGNDEKMVSLEIISNKPLPVVGYNCFVTTEDPKDQQSVKWIFQGSNDGQTWTNLDMEANVYPLEQAMVTVYPLKDKSSFKNYRFVWNKDEFPARLGVELIKLKFIN